MESKKPSKNLKVVAFAGGVGGAKLALGLQSVLTPGNLTVIINTGDDFEHWGLTICPDIDTVIYNLAGVNNPAKGWGRADDTFNALKAMEQLGGEDWFLLGDQDIALHLRRTEWLRQGISLTEVTGRLRRCLGIQTEVLPMCDSPVRTLVHTEEDDLPFQHYFVRKQCQPHVLDLSFVGADSAQLSPDLREALEMADVMVICPSNPYLSIDPILHIPGMRKAIKQSSAPVIAVSPIVGGQAIKGPAAKIMTELGKEVSPTTVANHYFGIIDGFILDAVDADLQQSFDMPVQITDTLMTSLRVKKALASTILTFATSLEVYQSRQKVKARAGSTIAKVG